MRFDIDKAKQEILIEKEDIVEVKKIIRESDIPLKDKMILGKRYLVPQSYGFQFEVAIRRHFNLEKVKTRHWDAYSEQYGNIEIKTSVNQFSEDTYSLQQTRHSSYYNHEVDHYLICPFNIEKDEFGCFMVPQSIIDRMIDERVFGSSQGEKGDTFLFGLRYNSDHIFYKIMEEFRIL